MEMSFDDVSSYTLKQKQIVMLMSVYFQIPGEEGSNTLPGVYLH